VTRTDLRKVPSPDSMAAIFAITSVMVCLRAYFVSQLGKYVPGKAWAVVLRVGLVRSQGVSASVGGLATFCEVLTMMAIGSLVAGAHVVGRESGRAFLHGGLPEGSGGLVARPARHPGREPG